MKIFAYPHRIPSQVREPAVLIDMINQFKVKNDELGFNGILMFTSFNDAYDNWDLGHLVAQGSRQIPIVAIMPNWEHPVITARKIVSFQAIYDRPLAINWITGLELRDYQKLGLSFSKAERYKKLGEYVRIVKMLLTNSANKPIVFEGKYFNLIGHKLSCLPKHQVFHYVSGVSKECEEFLDEHPDFQQIAMGMPPGYQYGARVRGVGMGMIARPTEAEALAEFHKAFAIDKMSEAYSKLAASNSDSAWKKELSQKMHNREGDNGFFAAALLHYSELGFLVKSYKGAAEYFRQLKDKKIDTFLLSLLTPNDLEHTRRVFDLV